MKLSDINKIGIEPSIHCNLSCELCSTHTKKISTSKKGFLGIDAIKNLNLGLKPDIIVSLYGAGEPTLNPQIIDIIKEIRNPLSIGTNGATHDEKWWYNVAKIMPERHAMNFALDGVDQESYGYYRHGGNYNKIINNMRAFIDGGGKAVWQFIIFQHNEDKVEEAERLSKEYGCKRIKFLPSWMYDNTYQSPIKYKIKSEKTYHEPQQNCRISNGEIFVSSDGNYLSCCLTWNLSHVLQIGGCKPFKNAYKDKLVDVLESGYYDDMLKRVKNIRRCLLCFVDCGQRIALNANDIAKNLG